eukprot:GHVU01129052.1.p1 GENE.GHVU01129052.1~~GHVU01129052.1.p1  ORF type:complete len:463 (-),score=61.30 GHVU01129052.1:151-1359(-)
MATKIPDLARSADLDPPAGWLVVKRPFLSLFLCIAKFSLKFNMESDKDLQTALERLPPGPRVPTEKLELPHFLAGYVNKNFSSSTTLRSTNRGLRDEIRDMWVEGIDAGTRRALAEFITSRHFGQLPYANSSFPTSAKRKMLGEGTLDAKAQAHFQRGVKTLDAYVSQLLFAARTLRAFLGDPVLAQSIPRDLSGSCEDYLGRVTGVSELPQLIGGHRQDLAATLPSTLNAENLGQALLEGGLLTAVYPTSPQASEDDDGASAVRWFSLLSPGRGDTRNVVLHHRSHFPQGISSKKSRTSLALPEDLLEATRRSSSSSSSSGGGSPPAMYPPKACVFTFEGNSSRFELLLFYRGATPHTDSTRTYVRTRTYVHVRVRARVFACVRMIFVVCMCACLCADTCL